MKVFFRLGVFFYVAITLFLVFLILILVFNVFPFNDIMNFIGVIYYNSNFQVAYFVVALALLILNHIFWGTITGNQQRGKLIAFDNPSGRVTVSLSAIEDLIQRVVARASEVKEVRSNIIAGKKGLEVMIRLVLNADINIPELTSHLQELVKRKIQDIIGIEETVVVKVDVTKIIPDSKSRRHIEEDKKDDLTDNPIPFHGYRA